MSGLARSRMMLVRTSQPAIEAWSSSCPRRTRNGGCAARLPLRRPTEDPSRARLEEADGTCMWRCGLPTGDLVHVAPGKRQNQVRFCSEARRLAPMSSREVFSERAISPVFSQLTLGHSLGAYPAPCGTARLCFPLTGALRVSAFRKSLLQRAKTQKDFPNLPKKRRLALGSGAHSRRFAQECPEGNPGKYRQEK